MQNIRNKYEESVFNAMKQHCYSMDKNHNSFEIADGGKAKKAVNSALKMLTITDKGEITCKICNKQLHPGDRNKLSPLSELCVQVIQHTSYSIGCSENRKPIDETQKTFIFCYPFTELHKNRLQTFKDSLLQCNTRPTEQTEKDEKDEMEMIQNTAINHLLFFRSSTSNNRLTREYGCFRCGIIIDASLAEHLLYSLTESGKHIGSYLNRCSPVCHHDRRSLAESHFSLDDYHSMIRTRTSAEAMHSPSQPRHSMDTNIDRLFENNFSRRNGSVREALKDQLKQTFKREFNKRSSDEQQAILSNPENNAFTEEMEALFGVAQTTGNIPENYTAIIPIMQKPLCITPACTRAETVANIAFSCGHIYYCNNCWMTELATINEKKCSKCAKDIDFYLSLDNEKSYDLDGSEIIDMATDQDPL